jgi:hypothetical protein
VFDYIENGKRLFYHTFTPEIFFVTDEDGVVVSPIEVNLGRNKPYNFLSMTADDRGEPTPQAVKDRAAESIKTYLKVSWDGKEIEYK